jgi:hypothetical protein
MAISHPAERSPVADRGPVPVGAIAICGSGLVEEAVLAASCPHRYA